MIALHAGGALGALGAWGTTCGSAGRWRKRPVRESAQCVTEETARDAAQTSTRAR